MLGHLVQVGSPSPQLHANQRPAARHTLTQHEICACRYCTCMCIWVAAWIRTHAICWRGAYAPCPCACVSKAAVPRLWQTSYNKRLRYIYSYLHTVAWVAMRGCSNAPELVLAMLSCEGNAAATRLLEHELPHGMELRPSMMGASVRQGL